MHANLHGTGTVLNPCNCPTSALYVSGNKHLDVLLPGWGRYSKIEAVKPRGMFREMPPDEHTTVATGEANARATGDDTDWEPAQTAGDRDQSLNELLANYAAAVARTTEEGGASNPTVLLRYTGTGADTEQAIKNSRFAYRVPCSGGRGAFLSCVVALQISACSFAVILLAAADTSKRARPGNRTTHQRTTL